MDPNHGRPLLAGLRPRLAPNLATEAMGPGSALAGRSLGRDDKDYSHLLRVAAFLAGGFEQEPGAPLGLVDEGLEQAGGAGILVLVAQLVRFAHRGRHVLVV